MNFKSLKERFMTGKRALMNRNVFFLIRKVYNNYWFDLKYSLNTSSFKYMHELEIDSENKKHGKVYMPTDINMFRNVLKEINCDFKNFTFVDFGCGKGKVLFLASDYNFKKIKGVEFSKELCDVCNNNINRFQLKSKTQSNIEVIHDDASKYNIDLEDSFFYFYNPFESVIFEKVLDNIDLSISKHKRKIFIVYIKPLYTDLFEHRSYDIVYHLKDEAIVYTNNI